MYPEIYKFDFNGDEFVVHGYGLMIALGVFVAYIVILLRRRNIGVTTFQISTLTILLILSTFLGGRLALLLTYNIKISFTTLLSNGGFVFYGAFVLGILTLMLWTYVLRISARNFLDEFAIVIPIIHGFGRIGCFMAGCCYGLECKNAIGLIFTNPQSQAIPLNQPLYPTQLLEVFLNIIIVVVLVIGRKYKKFQFAGQQFLVYILIYALGRFNIDFLRGDYLNNDVLHQSQVVAICLAIVGSFFWWLWSRNINKQFS